MKRTIWAALCLLLTMMLALPVNAATSGTFLREEYEVSQEYAIFYGRELPVGGNLLVSIDGEKVENPVYGTLESEKIPVTVYCLIDTSSALSQSAMQQQKDILMAISNWMRPEDNMVLTFLDDSLTEGKALQDRAARNTAIETMPRKKWFCSLFQGISEAMDTLETNTSYHANRCLLILSDGRDSGRTTVTSEQILEKIQASTIPVHSVLVGSGTKKDRDNQKRFAEASLGGIYCRSGGTDASVTSAAETVWSAILNGSVIQIPRAALGDGTADRSVLVRYDAGETRFEDTVTVRAVDIPKLELADTTETDAPTEEMEDVEDTESGFFWIFALAGGVFLATAVVLLVVLRKKRKHTQPGSGLEDVPGAESDGGGVEGGYILSDDSYQELGTSTLEVTQPIQSGCRVSIVAIMHPEIQVEFSLIPQMETTFGRDRRADLVLNSNDQKLSGLHASLLWDGKMLLIKDKGSTNGTRVNEEPCFRDAWIRVENGAKIRAGGYEYRVNYEIDE